MRDFDHILIAIHGIGSQSRNATARYVATRLAQSSAAMVNPGDLPNLYKRPPVAPLPLGWFYSDAKNAVKVAPLDHFEDDGEQHPLAGIGFTEVFWADIPQEVVEEGRTMEESKAWARTVVARARAVYKRAVLIVDEDAVPSQSRLKLREFLEPDFSLAAEVLEEIIDTVHVLENLTFLAEKAGIMKFHLDEVLEDYLGDVQIVTEFKFFRNAIVGRFHEAMERIHQDHPKAKLHIVAHSEGTVVSFLGLLHALSGEKLIPATANDGARLEKNQTVPPWLTKVDGYLTIGSPIDKHILLWPDLFGSFDFAPACSLFAGERKIHWRNYYDFGDPVGFELETARDFLHEQTCQPFEFEAKHDTGFARYMLPGKAHNDYWDDAAVFEHYIRDVIRAEGDNAPKPETIPRVDWISPAIPYTLSAVLLFAGTFLLYTVVTDYMHPGQDALQRYIRFNVLGTSATPSAPGFTIFRNALAITALIAGVTLCARLPRLAAGLRWYVYGFFAWFVGCLSYYGVEHESRSEIGHVFRNAGGQAHTLGIFFLCLVVVAIALWGTKKPSHEFGQFRHREVPRKKRVFFKGMRPLIVPGTAAVALLVIGQTFQRAPLKPEERANLSRETVHDLNKARLNRAEAEKLLYVDDATGSSHVMNEEKRIHDLTALVTPRAALWPLLLGAAAFLYLWWLAALVFDLAFVWHRYIRKAMAERHLHRWKKRSGETTAAAAAATSPPACA